MNKKMFCIALVFLAVFVAGTVFADELLQCNDPADGTVKITFLGDIVQADYAGKSAQNFDVWVLLKDGTTQKLSFSFPRTQAAQTRIPQTKQARGPIESVANCSFTSY